MQPINPTRRIVKKRILLRGRQLPCQFLAGIPEHPIRATLAVYRVVTLENARSLIARYRRENTLEVVTGKRKGIGVTDTGGHYLNQDLSRAWAIKV